MTRRMLLRLARGLLVTWAAYTTVFFLVFGAGDPAVAQLGAQARPEQLARFRSEHGLDRPVWELYFAHLSDLAHGDLGTTYTSGRPVAQVVRERLPRTALLGSMALTLELLFGITLGALAARSRNRLLDVLAMSFAFLCVSAPTFLIGILLLYVVAFRFGALPVGGYGTTPLEHVQHAILPALTISLVGMATYARLTRGELVEALRSDYVRTARAKGLSPARVFYHAFRNALLPVATLFGMSLPMLVSGAIVTEQVFQWPGLGRLAVEAIVSRDVPTVLAVVLLSSLAVQFGNLVGDVLVAALDPRVRDRM
jgi:peptide/nickel transport system permease protein